MTAAFPLACSCGERFRNTNDWQTHNLSVWNYRDHRLEVAA